jgi:hypothetical protein
MTQELAIVVIAAMIGIPALVLLSMVIIFKVAFAEHDDD